MTAVPFRCKVSADLVRRAHQCVSTDKSRPAIGGVSVEALPQGGALLIATNGRIMVVLHDPDGIVIGGPRTLFPSKAMLVKSKPRYLNEAEEYVVSDTRAAVVVRDLDNIWNVIDPANHPGDNVSATQWKDVLLDQSFPDYRRVIPRTIEPDAPISPFNADLLGMLAKAFSRQKTSTVLSLVASGKPKNDGTPSSDAILVIPRGIDGFGVIVPVRDSKLSKLPAWMGDGDAK